MKLSTKTIYGLKVTLTLYNEKIYIGLNDLVKKLNCNKSLLNKVLYELVASDILVSKKGPSGGFKINKNDVTCLEVAKALGEKIDSDDISIDVSRDIGHLSSFIAQSLNIDISSLVDYKNEVYLDYAATTPLDEKVLAAMMPLLTLEYGNANSVHSLGRVAAGKLDNARRIISGIINSEKREVFFTSGGTEGNNWIVKEGSKAIREKTGRNKVLISCIEHPSVYESAFSLVKDGFKVYEIPVDKNGKIKEEELYALLDEKTALVSIMTANNEIGTIQNIKELVAETHKVGAYFHTDAVQALGCMEIDVKATNVDYMTFSSHKFYGPKGVGGVYIKQGVPINPLIIGGHQERTRRGGTSNVVGIVGMAEALKLSRVDLEETNNRIKMLRDYLEKSLAYAYMCAHINGNKSERIPSNLSVTFRGYRADALLDQLDIKGVAASAGSACSSGSIKPSKVLSAIGLSDDDAKSTIRFSLGKHTTKEEIDFVINVVGSCLN